MTSSTESRVLGYVIIDAESVGTMPTKPAIELHFPEVLYTDLAEAEREAVRAQAHADIDADLTETRIVYSVAEVRTITGISGVAVDHIRLDDGSEADLFDKPEAHQQAVSA